MQGRYGSGMGGLALSGIPLIAIFNSTIMCMTNNARSELSSSAMCCLVYSPIELRGDGAETYTCEPTLRSFYKRKADRLVKYHNRCSNSRGATNLHKRYSTAP